MLLRPCDQRPLEDENTLPDSLGCQVTVLLRAEPAQPTSQVQVPAREPAQELPTMLTAVFTGSPAACSSPQPGWRFRPVSMPDDP